MCGCGLGLVHVIIASHTRYTSAVRCGQGVARSVLLELHAPLKGPQLVLHFLDVLLQLVERVDPVGGEVWLELQLLGHRLARLDQRVRTVLDLILNTSTLHNQANTSYRFSVFVILRARSL